jgi:hypothetical protein
MERMRKNIFGRLLGKVFFTEESKWIKLRSMMKESFGDEKRKTPFKNLLVAQIITERNILVLCQVEVLIIKLSSLI